MTEEELYNQIVKLLPIRCDKLKTDFRKLIKESFDDYLNQLELFLKSEPDRNGEVDIESIRNICEKINGIIECQYAGLHSESFIKFKKLMEGKDGLLSYFEQNIDGKLASFYRMRKFDSKRGITYKDMFHIPFNRRGLTSTQRYSAPGYPCLYMGESVYACWEELNRPHFDSFMVSRLEVSLPLHLIDFRIPVKDDYEKNLKGVLLKFPLIMVCMVQVLNEDDNFKPEYIIPQLLMEYLISFNQESIKKDDIHPLSYIYGIRYTSVHKNEEFDFPECRFDNVVIPVIKPLSSTDYCPDLIDLFKITNPTCEEYERAKGCYGESLLQKAAYTPEELKFRKYQVSAFGIIEESLNDFPLYRMS